MSAERVAAIEPDSQGSSMTVGPTQLRIAGMPERSPVRSLLELAHALAREAETLARDQEFTERFNQLETLDVSQGVDFYREVERFETSLIKLALEQTGGHQARAAQLLRIKATTLNSKIKLYGIEY
ncbi:MAG: helix-turn-helix domain-containing protein [Pyrinomonadaceae bacterium]